MTPIKISREANDSICLRASIGGYPGQGFYCVYRLGPEGGKRADIIEMLKTIVSVMENMPADESIEDDREK